MEAQTQYDSVIGEIVDVCVIFMKFEGDLVDAMTNSAISIDKISEQSSEQMEMLEILKKKVVSLLEQVASDKAMIEFLEKAAADGGGNTVELQKEVHRLQAENKEENEEHKVLLETNRNNRNTARSLNEVVKNLETQLEASNKIKNVALMQIEEMKRELVDLRAASLSNTVVKQELADLRAVSMSNEPMESQNKNLTSLLEKSKQDLLEMKEQKEELHRQLVEKNDEVVSTSQESQTAREQLIRKFDALMLVKTQLQEDIHELQESYNELLQKLDASKREALEIKDRVVPVEILLLEEAGEEAVEEGVDSGEDVHILPVDILPVAFLDDPVVSLVRHDPQVLLEYIQVHVFINSTQGLAKFKSTLTQKGERGKDLNETSLIQLIESLQNEPLEEIVSQWPTFSSTLHTHDWWALDNGNLISYEQIAREHLGV
jgi:myosin heavy subunit